MISGVSPARRCVWVALVLLAAAIHATVASGADARDAAAWDIKRLMHELAQVKSSKGKFVERKHMAILNAPLESSGTLIYTAPDKLEKHTLAPRQESMVLERDRLMLENKERNQRRSIALRDYPVVWAFVESIRSTLAGDLATLNRFYQVSLEGNERQWRLVLKPIEPAMQEVVSEIRLDGSRNWIGAIEFVETQGDRSLMTITRETP